VTGSSVASIEDSTFMAAPYAKPAFRQIDSAQAGPDKMESNRIDQTPFQAKRQRLAGKLSPMTALAAV
jgi:hypothetical protein